MNDEAAAVLRVGICGLGTVGAGTLKLLEDNAGDIQSRGAVPIKVVHVATRTPKPELTANVPRTGTDPMAVALDPEVDVLVETMGGYEPAKSVVAAALQQGKHVVTANKALIAEQGSELIELAESKGVTLAFESAVAGGIPIVKALREGLAANRIQRIIGIINGTGNFILTEMGKGNRPFADVLAEAQQLGYAEADPTFDVEGIDAAHKLTILASIGFGLPLDFSKTFTEGISRITPEDIAYARDLGYRIKHLGIAQCAGEHAEVRVHPALIEDGQLIAHVDGVGNAVLVTGDAVGDTHFTGPGAGAAATASAVVADLVDLARQRRAGLAVPLLPTLSYSKPKQGLRVLPIEETQSEFYLRIPALDKTGVMARITGLLERHGIGIEAVIQKEPVSQIVPIIILSDQVVEAKIDQAIAAIEALDEVVDSICRIRVAPTESVNA